MSLADDLAEAEKRAVAGNQWTAACTLCEKIREIKDPETRSALESAAAGKIGVGKLTRILRDHGMGVHERVVYRHRQEGHTP